MRWPSGENVACQTRPVWPERVASSWPLLAFHTRAVSSSLAVTMRLAIGGKSGVPERISMAGGGDQQLAASGIPHSRCMVGASSDHPLAVAGKLGVFDIRSVTGKRG